MNLAWNVRWLLEMLLLFTVCITDKEREARCLAALSNAHRKLKIEIGDLSDRLKVLM